MSYKKDSSPREIIKRLTTLVATSSISSMDPSWDEGNRQVIYSLAEWSRNLGFSCEILNVSPNGHKANLIATRGTGLGGLILAGHADTVPYDTDHWKSDPFKLSEREGRLYGLGSADMKGFFPLALAAASKFSEIKLKHPLILLATADEESSMNGARSIAAAGRPKARAAIIGEPTSLVPIRMHKGISMFSVKVTGQSGHSSNPMLGKNALDGMHKVMKEILDFRSGLTHSQIPNLFDVPGPTLNMGSIHGGDNPNRICGEVEMQFDLRLTPDSDFEAIKDELENRVLNVGDDLGLQVDFKTLMPSIPPFQQDSKSEIVRLSEKLTGHSASAVNFATEAPFLQSLGMETIVLGPGSIKRAHQPNEYLELEQIQPYITVLEECIAKYCL